MRCSCCGSKELDSRKILWPRLVQEWGLTPEEENYINCQQGLFCKSCRSSFRSMALAKGIMSCFGRNDVFSDFVAIHEWISVLEINEAGELHGLLSKLPKHTFATYPEVDMQRLPYNKGAFDLVVHSDTLEHVPAPMLGLAECHRVLRPGGFLVFTVPLLVGRLTRDRRGLAPSYHGSESNRSPDYLVHTEFGADAWTQVIRAGFSECRIHSLEYPCALAVIGVK